MIRFSLSIEIAAFVGMGILLWLFYDYMTHDWALDPGGRGARLIMLLTGATLVSPKILEGLIRALKLWKGKD